MKYKALLVSFCICLLLSMFFLFTSQKNDFNDQLINRIDNRQSKDISQQFMFMSDELDIIEYGFDLKEIINEIYALAKQDGVLLLVDKSIYDMNQSTVYVGGDDALFSAYISQLPLINGETKQDNGYVVHSYQTTEFGQLGFIGSITNRKPFYSVVHLTQLERDHHYIYTISGTQDQRTLFLEDLTTLIQNKELPVTVWVSDLNQQPTEKKLVQLSDLQTVVFIGMFLISALMFFELIRKSKRHIQVMKQHGYPTRTIGWILFRWPLFCSVISLMSAWVSFYVTQRLAVNRVTQPFFIRQLMLMGFVLFMILVVIAVCMIIIRLSNTVNQLKQKGVLSQSFYVYILIQGILFAAFIGPINMYTSSSIKGIKTQNYLNEYKDILQKGTVINAIYSRPGDFEIQQALSVHPDIYYVSRLMDTIDLLGYEVNVQYAYRFFDESILSRLRNTTNNLVIHLKGQEKEMRYASDILRCAGDCEYMEVNKLPEVLDLSSFKQGSIPINGRVIVIRQTKNGFGSSIFTVEDQEGVTSRFESILEEVGGVGLYKLVSTKDTYDLLSLGLGQSIIERVGGLFIYLIAWLFLLLISSRIYVVTKGNLLLNYMNHGYPVHLLLRPYLIANAVMYGVLIVYAYLFVPTQLKDFRLIMVSCIWSFCFPLFTIRKAINRERKEIL